MLMNTTFLGDSFSIKWQSRELLQYVCSEFLTNVKKHVIIEKMKRTAKEQKGDVVC